MIMFRCTIRAIVSLYLLAASLQAQTVEVSAERIRAHIRFLADDVLEGRAVGSRGGQLAARYIATQLELAGARPAGDHSKFFQTIPMIGVQTQPNATLTARAEDKPANEPAGKPNIQDVSFRWLDDFVGVTQTQKPDEIVEGEAIFVGYGISAPEFGWDDFKGIDVSGKILILFTNEPQSDDQGFFAGPALTYYGRWTYKFEEAARRGAKAVFIIHTMPTAGYGFEVVRSSWGKEDPQLKLPPGEPALSFAGWLTKEAAQRLLVLAGKDVDELLAAANSKDFQPISLGIHLRATIPTTIRQFESENVVAIVPGSDPVLRDQAVIFSAHWDHLGVGPAINGDSIYNGAVDNASGCAVLLELARVWSNLNPKPRRSAVFLAVTAEEAGLRGSAFYASHPFVPIAKTAADINFDGILPFGQTRDIFLTGAEQTTLWPLVQRAANQMQLEIKPDAHPEQGHYYRSDHFSLARAGVPAFTIQLGTLLEGKPAAYGEQVVQEYNSQRYHQPSDEYNDTWNIAGMEEVLQLGLRIGMDVANQEKLPARIK
jgi:Zn-dependent M28 family amino/carboxypeptidase